MVCGYLLNKTGEHGQWERKRGREREGRCRQRERGSPRKSEARREGGEGDTGGEQVGKEVRLSEVKGSEGELNHR